ncbi:MAG TPA: tetratricopeptide repeat protein [Gemmatimonadaceae bacterium]|nr:tetratricopeptide repeat protein [Gemmatimonadaceae bacterium]
MRTVVAFAAVLVALNLVVYWSVWRHEFVSFDDPQYVTENAHVTAGLSWAGVRWALTTGTAGNWHPLTWISHMADVQLFGVSAGPHHVTNLLLHILNSLLLFGVLWRMTGAFGRSGVVAALFAVHPLHVESVAWISERKDVLSTLFWLLAMWAYVEYVRRDKWAWYAAVVLWLALGLMSKPMVVTLPCVLLLLDYWPLERQLTKRLIVEKLPLFALVAVSSVVTFFAQSRGGAVSALAALPVTSRIENALLAYAAYIEKVIWPSGLAALYPYPREFGWRPILALVLLLAVTGAAIVAARRRHRYVLVGWLWYLGTLVPVIGLVQVGIQSMADRYTYVPSIGLFVIAAWGVPDLLRTIPQRRYVLATAAAGLILACALVAHAQVQYWRNSFILWTHANLVNPHDAHVETALGSVLAEQGDVAEAAALYTDALQREPQFAEAHNKLGVVFADQGKIADAIPEYQAALRSKPSLAEAHYNLGNALARQGRYAEAVGEYNAALRLRPDDAAVHNGLGSVLDDEGRLGDAIAEYQEALRLNPKFGDAHNNLGAARAKQGRTDDAIAEFLEALKLNPNQADAHYNVAVMLNERGRTAEAVQHLQEALRIKTNHPGARQALQSIAGRSQ